MRCTGLLVLLAACGDPPPLELKFALTTNPSQPCYASLADKTPAHTCSDVKMLCKSVLSIRILSPADPTAPYISLCQEVLGQPDLCSIAGIDLPPPLQKIPSQTLEVQVAVYNDHDLDHDDAGNPICPTNIEFAPDGLPLLAAPSPAVGGRAFYHPGDSSTVVALGCTDEAAIQSCVGPDMTEVTATVEDFDTQVSVPPSLADNLNVLAGEPMGVAVGPDTVYELSPSQTRTLDRTTIGPTPGWSAAVDLPLTASGCIEVLEDVPQATPSVTCKQRTMPGPFNLNGMRLAKSTLDQLLMALPAHPTLFPADGLVVGIVLDPLGNPVANASVDVPALSSVFYLSENRQNLIAGVTTSNGIFVSTDAPYGTSFSVGESTAFGGLIEGKVSIVVLQTSPPHP